MSATEARAGGATQRSADQLLEQLGAELDRAYAGSVPRRRHRARVALAAWTLLALAASLAAILLTRHGATPPSRPVSAVTGLIARGRSAGLSWGLAATRCSGARGFRVSLVTERGTATSGCGGVLRPPATIYDTVTGAGVVFGAAPAASVRVEISQSGGVQSTPRIVRVARLTHAVFYAGSVALAQTVTAMTAYASGSRLIAACTDERCVVP